MLQWCGSFGRVACNRVVFSGGVEFHSMLHQIKFLSWGWFANRTGNNFSLDFGSWCFETVDVIYEMCGVLCDMVYCLLLSGLN